MIENVSLVLFMIMIFSLCIILIIETIRKTSHADEILDRVEKYIDDITKPKKDQ